MIKREKVVEGLRHCTSHNDGRDKFGGVGKCGGCPYYGHDCTDRMKKDALALLKEQDSLLGIQQTADGITFISTGTAQQGEERGILLGKSLMHEWIYKELLHRGLLTDEIRLVFEQAKRI